MIIKETGKSLSLEGGDYMTKMVLNFRVEII